MCQGSETLRQSPRCASASGMLPARFGIRNSSTSMNAIQRNSPPKFDGRVGVGQHLVVDLAPEPRVAEDLRARARRSAPPPAACRAGSAASRRCSRCRRRGTAAPRRGRGTPPTRGCAAPRRVTISATATPSRPGAGARRADADLADLAEDREFPEHARAPVRSGRRSSIRSARIGKGRCGGRRGAPDTRTGKPGRGACGWGSTTAAPRSRASCSAGDGAERARARVPTPRFDYDGGIRAIRGLMERLEAEAGGRIETGGHRRAGLGRPRHRPRLDAATRPGCTAATCGATSPPRSTGRSGSPTTPTASRSPRRWTAAAPGRAGGLRHHPRHRGRRRHRGARAAGRGRQRHRRRVGAHPAAGAARRRAPRAALLLRRARATSRPGCPARASPPTTPGASAPRRARGRASAEIVALADGRRRGGRGDAAPLRGPARPRAGGDRQRARPGRDRGRRRPLERGAPLRDGAAAHPARTSSATASTPASCANLHGDSSGVRGAAWL